MIEDLNIHAYNIGEEEKEIDRQLRPQRFEDFNGRIKLSIISGSLLKPPGSEMNHWIMFCCRVLRDWGKQRWPISSQGNWGAI